MIIIIVIVMAETQVAIMKMHMRVPSFSLPCWLCRLAQGVISREDVDESFFKAIPSENEGIEIIYPVRLRISYPLRSCPLPSPPGPRPLGLGRNSVLDLMSTDFLHSLHPTAGAHYSTQAV